MLDASGFAHALTSNDQGIHVKDEFSPQTIFNGFSVIITTTKG